MQRSSIEPPTPGLGGEHSNHYTNCSYIEGTKYKEIERKLKKEGEKKKEIGRKKRNRKKNKERGGEIEHEKLARKRRQKKDSQRKEIKHDH